MTLMQLVILAILSESDTANLFVEGEGETLRLNGDLPLRPGELEQMTGRDWIELGEGGRVVPLNAGGVAFVEASRLLAAGQGGPGPALLEAVGLLLQACGAVAAGGGASQLAPHVEAVRARLAEVDEAPECRCGLVMTRNPHPKAGDPALLCQVGATYECIPCTAQALHNWSTRALAAERERDDLRRALERLASWEVPAAEVSWAEMSEAERRCRNAMSDMKLEAGRALAALSRPAAQPGEQQPERDTDRSRQ